MEVIITKSSNKNKKFDALVDGKKISFGDNRYEDFTMFKKDNDKINEKRKQNYIERHKKNEKWGIDGIKTPGFYSRWILWHMPTIEASIADLNKKYKDIKFKYVK
jgi:hypothetical protein